MVQKRAVLAALTGWRCEGLWRRGLSWSKVVMERCQRTSACRVMHSGGWIDALDAVSCGRKSGATASRRRA